MTKTTFTNGTIVTPEFLNSINNPIFDGTDFDGHFSLITDSDLSNVAGNVKPEWQGFRDTLKVSPGTGLSASYLGGAIMLPNGETGAIAPGVVTLGNNATNYVYVRDTGIVERGSFLPSRCIPLAKIITAAGIISGAIIDLRPRFSVLPLAIAIKVFGGSGDEGDYNLTTGTATLDRGFYYYKNFTVTAGATINISPFAKIFCSGDVNIAGTINVNFFASGGAVFQTSINNGPIGGLSGSGPGGGSGSSNQGGQAYNYAATPYGSGGGSGFITLSTGSADIASGGKGGGGIWVEAAGSIVVTGSINARGESGKMGAVAGVGSASGGGGGSGGLVLLSSLRSINVAFSSQIDVRGGAGGNGIGNGDGGSGGGGGQVVLISPTINSIGTMLLSGGSKGVASSLGNLGGGGGGGFGGTGGGQTAGNTGQLITRNIIPVGN